MAAVDPVVVADAVNGLGRVMPADVRLSPSLAEIMVRAGLDPADSLHRKALACGLVLAGHLSPSDSIAVAAAVQSSPVSP